jgi:hypothetical protein
MSDYSVMLELAMQYAPEAQKEKLGLVPPPPTTDEKDEPAKPVVHPAPNPPVSTQKK